MEHIQQKTTGLNALQIIQLRYTDIATKQRFLVLSADMPKEYK